MDRRSLLSAIVGSASLCFTGCVGLDDQRPSTSEPEEDSPVNNSGSHTVSVTKYVESQSGLVRVFRVTEGGDLEYTLTCIDGTQKTVSGAVSAEEFSSLKEMVLSINQLDIMEEYTCSSGCPQDIPPTHLELTTDGSTVKTVIEASADTPSELEAIVSKLDTFEDALEKPSCK